MIENHSITFGDMKKWLKEACASVHKRLLEPGTAKETVVIEIPEGSRFGLKYTATEITKCGIGKQEATISYTADERGLINVCVDHILKEKGVGTAIREDYSKYYSVENLVPYTTEPKEPGDVFMTFDLKKFVD